jgi:hypothetical protein
MRGVIGRAAMWGRVARSVRSGPLIAAALGIAIALVGFGPAYIFGTSPFWDYPPIDFSSHLIGWREFVQEPWTFPLLLSKRLDPPEGLNIVFLDSLPLVALFAKLLRPLAPAGFVRTLIDNPLGWWQLVSYALQGAFAAVLARLLGAAREAQLAAAVMALSMQIFITRFYHTGLNSHFLILAALCLYVRSRRPSSSEWGNSAWWAFLLVCAVLLHPYLFAMAFGIFLATVAELIARAPRRPVRAIVTLATSGAAVATAMAVSGYFGARLARASDWGFGYKSTDLLSFVVPQYSPFFPYRAHRMALDLAHDEAAEGYDYLGLGLIVLALVLVVTARASILQTIRRNKALALILLAMALFAISSRLSIGRHVVLEVPVPKTFRWLIGQLRASGRFIWPPTYAAAIYLVVLGYEKLRDGWKRYVPPMLVGIQFLDGMGNFAFVRNYTAKPERSWLDWSSFEPIILDHANDGVTLWPSHSCIQAGHWYTAMMQMEIQTMAASRGVSIAGIRSSRELVNCTDETRARLLGSIDPNRLHVLFAPDVGLLETVHFERFGASCVAFGTPPRAGILCSKNRSRMDQAGFSEVEGPTVAIGERIKIGDDSAAQVLGAGWSYGEGTHRWTIAPLASLYFRTKLPIPPNTVLRLRAGAAVFPNRSRLAITFVMNGVTLPPTPETTVTTLEARTMEVPVPEVVVGSQRLEVHLRFDDVRSPKQLGEGEDTRNLGLAVQEIALETPR